MFCFVFCFLFFVFVFVFVFCFVFVFVFVFFIINEDCSFCVLFYVQLHLFIVYIKEKMLSVEKLVSDPIVILGQ